MSLIRKIPGYYIGYRALMKLAHKFHWHYAPPCYPDGDTMLWCHWCGLRQVVRKRGYKPTIEKTLDEMQNNVAKSPLG